MDPKRPRLDEGSIGNDLIVPESGESATPTDDETPEDPLSLLEKLPDDVKWMIFKMLVGSLHNLKKASKTMWKNVKDWTVMKNLPPFELLSISVTSQIEAELVVSMEIYRDFPCLQERFKLGVAAIIPLRPQLQQYGIQLQLDQLALAVPLLRDLFALKYRRIKLVLSERPTSSESPDAYVQELLADAKECDVFELLADLIDEERRTLIDTITTKFPIKRMELSVSRCPGRFLPDLAERVAEIEIRDRPFTLLGNFDWGELAVDMFKKGATSVRFIIKDDLSFMTTESLAVVRSYFSTSKTKHIFCTTHDFFAFCRHIKELCFQRNMIPNYRLGNYCTMDFGQRWHYLRYRHEDLVAGEVDELETLVVPSRNVGVFLPRSNV